MQKIMFFMVSLSCYQQQNWMAFPSLHTAVCFSAFEKGNIHVGYKALKNERILRREIEFLT